MRASFHNVLYTGPFGTATIPKVFTICILYISCLFTLISYFVFSSKVFSNLLCAVNMIAAGEAMMVAKKGKLETKRFFSFFVKFFSYFILFFQLDLISKHFGMPSDQALVTVLFGKLAVHLWCKVCLLQFLFVYFLSAVCLHFYYIVYIFTKEIMTHHLILNFIAKTISFAMI